MRAPGFVFIVCLCAVTFVYYLRSYPPAGVVSRNAAALVSCRVLSGLVFFFLSSAVAHSFFFTELLR